MSRPRKRSPNPVPSSPPSHANLAGRSRILRFPFPWRLPAWLWIPLISLGAVLAWSRWEGNFGFDITDEGFLWDGVLRTYAGELPIRDFLAYDPGRYYWSAAVMWLLQNGSLLTLRAAIGLFEWGALSVGIWLLAPAGMKLRFFWSVLGAATLSVWMYPRHKIFDESLSILMAGVLAWWLAQPGSPRRALVAGVGLGLTAVFGRNHGVYGLAASFLAWMWILLLPANRPGAFRRISAWSGGVVLGFSPILLQCLFVPGYAAAFLESVLYILKAGTNLPLAVPWPWAGPNVYTAMLDDQRRVLVSWCFVLLPLVSGLGLGLVFWRRWHGLLTSPAIVAAFLFSLPYTHYTFSRPDIMYVAHGIFPCLIGSLAFLAGCRALIHWPVGALLLGLSYWIILPEHPGSRGRSAEHPYQTLQLAGEQIKVEQLSEEALGLVSHMEIVYGGLGRDAYIAPRWPGIYPLIGRRNPVWEIYAIVPRDAEFENREIAHLQQANLAYAIIVDAPLDGREDLRFSQTHPLTLKYISDRLVLHEGLSNPYIRVFVPKSAPDIPAP